MNTKHESELDYFKTKKFDELSDKLTFKKKAKVEKRNTTKGLAGILIIALGLVALYLGIEYSGWLLFFGFLKLDNRDGWKIFALCVLGMIGLYFNIPFASWLLFFTLFVD